MIGFPEAQQLVIAAAQPRSSEIVELTAVAGRVIARDIISSEDLVPYARSAMDGYAVRAADTNDAPLTLPIVAMAYAAPGSLAHASQTVTAIATGAAIPAGADAVIPIEDVDVRDGCVTIGYAVAPGASVFPPGDDARRGEVLLPNRTRVTPAGIGLLAAGGIVRIEVYRRPTVAILCGGDELVDARDVPGHGQIRDSNGSMLAAALAATGATVIPPVRLRDVYGAVRDALANAFESADLVVTTGGASVGERDFIKAACREIGVDFLFDTVGLRPAKPTAFGHRGEVLVAVLPGNPAAAFVALQEFVLPAVRSFGGDAQPLLPRVSAQLDGTIRAKPERHFAAFAALASNAGGFVATPLDNQCSSLTRTAVDAAGLIVVPPGSHVYVMGDRVEVDVFDWQQVRVGHNAARSPALA